MAIDKNQTRELLNNLDAFSDSILDTVMRDAPADQRQAVRTFLQEQVLGAAISEVRKLIQDSRPPRLMLIGRSGHGKSSVINALAGRPIAPTSDLEPLTPESIRYDVPFAETHSAWEVYDTRGIFESTRPGGAPDESAVAVLERDIKRYDPDVIIHVVSISAVRSMSEDLKVFRGIQDGLAVRKPTLVVLTHVDTLNPVAAWPIEENPRKLGQLRDVMDYLAGQILNVTYDPIDLNFAYKGYAIKDSTYLAIIPVTALKDEFEEKLWNIPVLSDFVGSVLPETALLSYYQAQRHKQQLRGVSSAVIERFSRLAGTIGASPVPVSDIIILTPLQLLMIAVVGGLSCRSFSYETCVEFLSAAGISVGAGFAARQVAQQVSKLFPILGSGLSAGIAYGGTRALGAAAEAYFFNSSTLQDQPPSAAALA